jgi:biopolymer transport protein ExbB
MNISHLIQLANDSGGTLYLMLILLLIALTVIIERTRYLSFMLHGGEQIIDMLKKNQGESELNAFAEKMKNLPHTQLLEVLSHEPANANSAVLGDHLEEALMHQVPKLDRSLWVLDTVITLAPLLGLFGTIVGMFNAFNVMGDIQNNTAQVTGGIAEALIATASGLLIAIIGLVFFNGLHTRVREVLHQLETIKIMLVNRHEQHQWTATKRPVADHSHTVSSQHVRAGM